MVDPSGLSADGLPAHDPGMYPRQPPGAMPQPRMLFPDLPIDKRWSPGDIMRFFERLVADCPGGKEAVELFRRFWWNVVSKTKVWEGPHMCWRWAGALRNNYADELQAPKSKLAPHYGYFGLGENRNWINYNNGIEHRATVVVIHGCHGETYEFMLDDAWFGGIGNVHHILGPGDVTQQHVPFPDGPDDAEHPNWWLPDLWDWFKGRMQDGGNGQLPVTTW